MSREPPDKRLRNYPIRFPKQLYWKLQDLAHSRGKSINYVVVTALEDFVNETDRKCGYSELSPATIRDIISEAHKSDPKLISKLISEIESKGKQ